jgi:glycosyltransferase involved in cell wall biosynthesis
VVLEAMALRLPVIATAWGGMLDYLDESCGVLVPPDSRDALRRGFADAMRRLARDPGLRRRMGEAGHARVAERFTWSEKTARIEAIYREAIERTRAGATAADPVGAASAAGGTGRE